jgi:hypothetical protein
MKSVVVRFLSLALVAGTLSACSGSVTVGNDPYHQAWYDVYGTRCSNGQPTSGCNFYANGTKITASADPYSSNQYYSYDYWTYTDSYGQRRSYLGDAWFSSTGILYDAYGNALNEVDPESAQTADVIAQAAAQEKQVAKVVGKALAQKYALAEDKGVMISKTLQDWANLGKGGRARTQTDVSDFASRLYGVDASKAKNAIAQALASQSQQPIEELNVDVAAYWGTSPEVSKQILKGWYKDEVATYGIK